MHLRFGQVLARTNSTLSAVRLVRNLAEPHAQGETTDPTINQKLELRWLGFGM